MAEPIMQVTPLGALPSQVYLFHLKQTGTDAPVVTGVQGYLGAAMLSVYSGAGSYQLTLNVQAFSAVIPFINQPLQANTDELEIIQVSVTPPDIPGGNNFWVINIFTGKVTTTGDAGNVTLTATNAILDNDLMLLVI